MSDTVHCDMHGDANKTYVCTHLTGETSGLGFNRGELSDDTPYPNAWCDNCEIIRAAHGGWNKESENLTKIVLLCSGCYERARIRNIRPSLTLNQLASLRWKCGSCEEWHTGPMLDIAFDAPHYWSDEYEKGICWSVLPSGGIEKTNETFLTEDYCAIGDEFFFVRGIIHLPIIGTAESFCWGVWGSVSRENFEILLKTGEDSARADVVPMFSWLSNQISEYPDTLNLKMYAHIQKPGVRPHFRLEQIDHPLAEEYHHGISPERVREITFHNLPTEQQ